MTFLNLFYKNTKESRKILPNNTNCTKVFSFDISKYDSTYEKEKKNFKKRQTTTDELGKHVRQSQIRLGCVTDDVVVRLINSWVRISPMLVEIQQNYKPLARPFLLSVKVYNLLNVTDFDCLDLKCLFSRALVCRKIIGSRNFGQERKLNQNFLCTFFLLLLFFYIINKTIEYCS